MGLDPSRLIVALDFPHENMARSIVDRTAHLGVSFKIGLELYLQAGNEFVRKMTRQHQVMLDLKLHDIPNTVGGAIARVSDLGIWMTTLHASGGPQMMKAAAQAAQNLDPRPLVVAVTVLTSLDQGDLEVMGIKGPVNARVSSWAHLAQEAGLDGVVCSPEEISEVKTLAGAAFLTVTPGVRPAGAEIHDQSRVLTPAGAVRAGGDFLVVGRPITQAEDPQGAAVSILREMGVKV